MESQPSCGLLSFHEEDDTISLSDLIPDAEGFDSSYDPSFSPSRDSFEFSFANHIDHTTTSASSKAVDTIFFCGRAIPFEQPRYLTRSDHSFKRLSSLVGENDAGDDARPGTLRFPESSKPAIPTLAGSRSSKYSISSGRNKYKAIIGVTKYPSRMDMDEIKKRQSRQAPVPLFPATISQGVESTAITSHGNWGLLRLIRSSRRPHLVSTLARASFKCMRHV